MEVRCCTLTRVHSCERSYWGRRLGHYLKFGRERVSPRKLDYAGVGKQGCVCALQNPHFCATFDGFSKNTRKYARMARKSASTHCWKDSARRFWPKLDEWQRMGRARGPRVLSPRSRKGVEKNMLLKWKVSDERERGNETTTAGPRRSDWQRRHYRRLHTRCICPSFAPLNRFASVIAWACCRRGKQCFETTKTTYA